jgi:glutaredoxin 3
MRADLEWKREAFIEYDVEKDPGALKRVVKLCEGDCNVPVLVRNGEVVQVGYEGRSCYARVDR